jgi:uncharacterized Zn-binding protein involved in type VI secretion
MNKRFFIIIALLLLSIPVLSGCSDCYSDYEAMQAIEDYLADYLEDCESEEVIEGDIVSDGVTLLLTHPVGSSPKVFTTGWVFGARCSYEGKDYSSSVKWSGSGSFSPANGSISRPSFSGAGGNQIVLSVIIDDKQYSKTFNVNAISPAGYAYVGMRAKCPADSHGCQACPHPTVGPIISGSPNVFINGKPAARVGDRGVHAACCGPNTFEIIGGDGQVLINGRPAAKIGSPTQHCGGTGSIISG